MRIAFVLDDGLDSTDGVQQNILTLGQWLTKNGHEVDYLVGETKRADIANIKSLAKNISVRFNGNKLTVPLPASNKLVRKTVESGNYDIVHIQTPYSPFLGGRIIKASYEKNVATVSTFHILAYSRSVVVANRLLSLINRPTRKYITKHIAVSRPAADFAKKIYGYECSVLSNPFELKRFLVSSEETEADDKIANIVFLGRLVPRKGALELLRAIKIVTNQKKSSARFKVIIGGKGAQMEDLKKFTSENDLTDIVEFRGFISEEDKVSFLSHADIAVFPSISGESFGISLLEGMASARGVVVAGNNPGYSSVMGPEFPGQLIDPRNSQIFAEKLVDLLENPALRPSIAEKQKQYVRQFDVEQIGPRLVECYKDALKKHDKQA